MVVSLRCLLQYPEKGLVLTSRARAASASGIERYRMGPYPAWWSPHRASMGVVSWSYFRQYFPHSLASLCSTQHVQPYLAALYVPLRYTDRSVLSFMLGPKSAI